jgi:hypothetical protein
MPVSLAARALIWSPEYIVERARTAEPSRCARLLRVLCAYQGPACICQGVASIRRREGGQAAGRKAGDGIDTCRQSVGAAPGQIAGGGRGRQRPCRWGFSVRTRTGRRRTSAPSAARTLPSAFPRRYPPFPTGTAASSGSSLRMRDTPVSDRS